ncbi:PepSY domain-containing protein [Aerococcaceae bacterium NML191292]|nr:PepSY domain-containing protein [Aerococcaceae bacterium NML210727]MCW6654926.1 PepSY domain-containing protein [Aerococcaceae bacterium NML201296]MCW6660136.1 PepSY domain-containing protein [Aerococcaceae bacterium NML191292]MCW6662050.1 PepSY domain-containing protein [Aerococcaceae bacterium NML201209]MCW6667571.1 PepSY domain-containing protein [Aerococcaceae bacterium NML190938]
MKHLLHKASFTGLVVLLLSTTTLINIHAQESSSSSSPSVHVTSEQLKGEIKVSLEDAIKLYQETFPNVSITSIDLTAKLGRYVYQIEGVDDDMEYELTIDAQTKEVSGKRDYPLELDERNGFKRKNDALNLEKLKDLAEISKVVEQATGSGQIVEWELDRELNVTYWKITLVNGSEKLELKIDAQTADVLEVELDD